MNHDRQLQKDIIAALDYSPVIAAEHIGVAVQNGVVTLSGTVSSFAEKYAAEKACFHTRGVKAIADELDVLLPGSHVGSDTELAQAAADTLSWNVLVPRTIQVSVEKGCIILRGHVDWEFQRNAAEKALRHLSGVIEVVNHISIEKQVQAEEVQARIEHALDRRAHREPHSIQVEVNGSKVILRGTVHSVAERDDVKWAAWAVPGVAEVDSRLQIRGC